MLFYRKSSVRQFCHNLKQGQYAQGINDGLNQIIAASKGEFDAAQVEEDAFDKYIPFLMDIGIYCYCIIW